MKSNNMVKRANDRSESEDDGIRVSGKFLTLLTVGFAVVFIGIALLIVASLLGGNGVNVGGVVFIGPFPIVFGAGPNATWLILISLVISVVMIIIFVFMRRRRF